MHSGHLLTRGATGYIDFKTLRSLCIECTLIVLFLQCVGLTALVSGSDSDSDPATATASEEHLAPSRASRSRQPARWLT